MEATIYCCLCPRKFTVALETPEGWAHQYDLIEDETGGFCPDHGIVKAWVDSQCPGCVGGWGDCGLWKGFAYSSANLSEEDLEKIKTGHCPRRVNGTFSMDMIGKTMTDINLSNAAPVEAGEALAKAIGDYWLRYGVVESASPSDD